MADLGRGAAPDLFEHAPCGYVVTDDAGLIVRANAEFLRLAGRPEHDVVGTRTLPSLVSLGGRLFFETHLLPMLEHDATVREVALDLVRPDGGRTPVLFNANRLGAGASLAVRAVFIEARDRHRYEEDLLLATREAERASQEAAALAESLQQALIPPAPPRIPHLEIAAAYRPAGTGREVGGDFYDVFQVAPAEWVVVLGDVSGKGIAAATVTSLVRYTVRALAMEHRDPADLLRHLDAALQADATDRYCTLVLAYLSRVADRWELQLSLAGHPPAIVREPDGSVREIGLPGTPVGLVDEPYFETVRHRLADESVTLYTDGVTEARGRDGFFGQDRLEDLIGELPQSPRAITDALTHAVLEHQDGNASDDIAIVTFSASP